MAADIDIVIGAQNKASNILKEVERDSTNLGISWKSLAIAGGAFAAVNIALQGLGSIFTGISSMVAGSIADYDKEADAATALSRAIDLAGGSGKESIETHHAVADALERTANVESDVTLGLMRQAAMMGVSDRQLDDVAKAAIGLSQVMGIDLDDALKKVRLATEGHLESFNKTIPALKEMKTDEEKLEYVLSLTERGLIDKQAASDSATQADEKLNISVGNLMETIGGMLSPLRMIVLHGLTYMADAMETVLSPAVEAVQALFESWGPTIQGIVQWVVEEVIAGVTMMEVVYQNFWTVIAMVFSEIELLYVQFTESTMYTFTQVVPAYVMWFANNFTNIIRDLAVAVMTEITNLGKNLGEAVFAIFDWIANGFQGGFSGLMESLGKGMYVSLLDGFEATTESLPDIMERQITEREKQLKDNINGMAGRLGGDFATKYNERIKKLSEHERMDQEFMKDTKINLEIEKAVKVKADPELKAMESRLLTRGKTSDPLDKVAKNTEDTVKAIKDNTAAVKANAQSRSGSLEVEVIE